jgi:hypothetical protein
VVEVSTWENDWNSFFWSAGAMPIPVSFTVNRRSAEVEVSNSKEAWMRTSP